MLSGIKFYFELLTLWHFTSMERVMLKDMTTLEDEANIGREQGKLARNMITCLRSLYVNSLKETLPFSHNYFDTKELLTFCV